MPNKISERLSRFTLVAIAVFLFGLIVSISGGIVTIDRAVGVIEPRLEDFRCSRLTESERRSLEDEYKNHRHQALENLHRDFEQRMRQIEADADDLITLEFRDMENLLVVEPQMTSVSQSILTDQIIPVLSRPNKVLIEIQLRVSNRGIPFYPKDCQGCSDPGEVSCFS